MAKKQQEPERKICVIISNGKRNDKLETWRYWEIVGALQWMGADRQTAYDAAKWAMKAKQDDSLTVGEITMEVKDGEVH